MAPPDSGPVGGDKFDSTLAKALVRVAAWGWLVRRDTGWYLEISVRARAAMVDDDAGRGVNPTGDTSTAGKCAAWRAMRSQPVSVTCTPKAIRSNTLVFVKT